MDDLVKTPSTDAERSWAERRLTVLYETAHALAASASMADGVPRTLGAVCQALGWEYGAFWNVDQRGRVLRCVGTWSLPSLSFKAFEEASRTCTFAQGVGLPGRVWASGLPAWIPDVLAARLVCSWRSGRRRIGSTISSPSRATFFVSPAPTDGSCV